MNTDPSSRLGNIQRFGLVAAGVVGALAFAGCSGETSAQQAPPASAEAPAPITPSAAVEATPTPTAAAEGLHTNLENSNDPDLVRMGENEKKFGHRFDENMLFVDMPRDAEEAEAKAAEIASRLEEYARQGVKPLVIMEPTYDAGEETINLVTLADKKHEEGYRETMDSYFQALNWEFTRLGLQTEQVGTWVFFPEPNIPTWHEGITDPNIFKRNFTPTAQAFKTHFPDGNASVLLEQRSYYDGDINYQNQIQDPRRTLSYVSGIPEGLVDSFGIQGYPWGSNSGPNRLPEAADFVGSDMLIDGAQRLGVRNVWISTGTYSRTNIDGSMPKMTASQRGELLQDELEQLKAAQAAGLNVAMTIFGENKYPGDADWSYKTPDEQAALKQALADAQRNNIKTSFFDPAN